METNPRAGRTPPSGATDDPLAQSVAVVAHGDEAALRRVYDALAPRVLGLCNQILRDQASAEEAVIEVFSQVWRQAARYEPRKGSVATWITTMARTRAIDLRRSRARHATREAVLDAEELELFRDRGPAPHEVVAAGDRAERVHRALSTLSSDQRRAVEAAFFGGLSHSEIAAEFEEPLGTIKTRIRSGLVTLRTALASVEGEAC
jgi:RNA polymerase sigma-70 factor (ECF subfamily)